MDANGPPFLRICGNDACSDEPRQVGVVHPVPIVLRVWDAATETWHERQTIHEWFFCSPGCFETWAAWVRAATSRHSA